ncbi:hypothetical protein F3Y22_tig00111105pilonHSYRG00673 [Hibiscus syriacus]|uniref:Uncharacterized protein n=1 Tax=Hibiscus syriacus TaxID=106335 RepID=A0A6A2YZ59_HIBSY|nr:uncharacterized protein LOC120153739 [Hibiscus syriacus]KAE8684901.1 hypothetical protein F3Y22_tig00111105pilonHSYRG00673 [Hibiscus syriacus]
MASSSSSSSTSHTISPEELKLFHTIDRAIFCRLVLNLQREPFESMHVMALLLWLERSVACGENLVYTIQTWPDTFVDALAIESVQCLNCINSDEFPFGHFENDYCIVPLIRMLTNDDISLRFFHENRVEIVHGVVNLVHDVCYRAFDDIMKQALYGATIMPILPSLRPNFHGFDPEDVSSFRAQKKCMDNEMEDLWNRIHSVRISSSEEKKKGDDNNKEEVEADDRTIFLTFSKGYSVSEDEVRNFFTRRFGEVFEGIEMQEVEKGEQPLYAKLVLETGTTLEMILNGKPKAKFSINGKHVWARKFVRKTHKSPPKRHITSV